MTYLYIDPTGRGTTSTNNPQYVYGNDPEHDPYEWPYYPPFRNPPPTEEKR